MRKLRFLALIMLFSLLLASCARGGDTYLYENGTHTHVFGTRYDVIPVTCICEGSEIRYCKICHAAVTDTVQIPNDIAARHHAFSDTVVPPTECEEGYTVRNCTLCSYVIDRTDVVPARYALLTDSGTVTTSPEGAEGIVMSDTATHLLAFDVGREQEISPALARRLAVALVIAEELVREGGTLTLTTPITLVSGIGAGNTYTAGELLDVWAESGDPDVARGFATAMDGGEAAFSARVAARLQRLGVSGNITVDPFGETGTATLGATAVLLARALDEEVLVTAFAASVPGLIQIAGEKPVLYFTEANVRATVLRAANGTCRFLLVTADPLPPKTALEDELF